MAGIESFYIAFHQMALQQVLSKYWYN